jgi:multiple sugar transport system substrate-binding protein
MSSKGASMNKRKAFAVVAGVAAAASLIALSGCSAGGSTGAQSKTIKVAYEDFGSNVINAYMENVKKGFEANNEGVTVQLVPIKAAENDYYTKLSLMNRSASTAPDVLYEDTFLIKSDAAAGYLAPLDSYVSKWPDWSQFYDNAKSAGQGEDGKVYGVSLGTDTRALWYNKDILKKAGVPVPWKPKTWAEVLDAAKAVKANVPGVTPINVFSGKAAGEATSMQGMEMLLYGTKDTLYDTSSGKWVTGSKGFTDALGVVKDIYQGGLGLSPEVTSNANYATLVATDLLPKGKLAIDLDGSWMSLNWLKTGGAPWAQWNDVMGETPMPTQDGAKPGSTSLSGGWTLSVGSKSTAKDLAWKFVSTALNKNNSLAFDIAETQIPVRKDVGTDPKYTGSNPTSAFFSSLVAVTHFRPATTDYQKISNEIQVATEAVMSGQASPSAAAKAYDTAVVGIVGKDKTTAK